MENMVRIFRIVTAAAIICASALLLSSCSDGRLSGPDAGRPIQACAHSKYNLDSLGVAEEEPPAFKGAEDPKPIDTMALEKDYVFCTQRYCPHFDL